MCIISKYILLNTVRKVLAMLYKLLFPFYYIAHFTRLIFKKYYEFIFILINLSIYIIAILTQANVINAPIWLIMKTDNPEYFFQSVFQIQATISTLGITVLGLLAGLFSTKHYGITVTSYVLNIKPKILKHRIIIILSLTYIALDYIFMAIELYNLVIAILISSILICVKIASDVYWALLQGNSIKYEIHKALISRLETKKYTYPQGRNIDEVLYKIQYDLEEAVVSNDIVAIHDDLSAFKDAIWTYMHLLSEQKSSSSYIAYKSFANDCKRVIGCLLESGQENLIRLYLECFESIYSCFTNIKVHIDIWERVAPQFFNILKIIDPTKLLAENSIRELRKNIYCNITEDPDTWKGATHFLPSLYNALSSNQYYNQLTVNLRLQYWKDFVHTDTLSPTEYQLMTESRFLTKPRSDELFMLLRLIVDAEDKPVISVICPLGYDYVSVDTSVIAYVFCKQFNVFDPSAKEYYSNLYHNLRYRGIMRLSISSIVRHCDEARRYLNGSEYFESMYQMMPREMVLRFIIMYILKHYTPEKAAEVADALNHFREHEYDKSLANFIFCEGDLDTFMHQLLGFERNIFGEAIAKSNDNHLSLREFCKHYFVQIGLFQKSD